MAKRALLFCLTGIDGSGKTTQAQLLVKWLLSQGVKADYIWSRGAVRTMRGVFLFIGRRALGTSTYKITSDKKSYDEYQSHKSKLMDIWLVRTLWSVTTCFEHIVQINLDIRTKLWHGSVIVCDRYLWDSTIDMAILNKKGPEWLSRRFNRLVWKFVPEPDVTFFIDIHPEEAMQRKNDIPSLEYVTKRALLYRHLAKSGEFVLIDGSQNMETIQNHITNMVKNYVKG
jgi:thymidylate kinase